MDEFVKEEKLEKKLRLGKISEEEYETQLATMYKKYEYPVND